MGTMASTSSGYMSAHSSVCIPPSEPPTTSRTRFTPSALDERACARTMSRTVMPGSAEPRAAGRGVDRRRPGRPVAAAEDVRADDVVVLGIERAARAEQPVHQRSASALPVSAWQTTTALSPRPRARPSPVRHRGPAASRRARAPAGPGASGTASREARGPPVHRGGRLLPRVDCHARRKVPRVPQPRDGEHGGGDWPRDAGTAALHGAESPIAGAYPARRWSGSEPRPVEGGPPSPSSRARRRQRSRRRRRSVRGP